MHLMPFWAIIPSKFCLLLECGSVGEKKPKKPDLKNHNCSVFRPVSISQSVKVLTNKAEFLKFSLTIF